MEPLKVPPPGRAPLTFRGALPVRGAPFVAPQKRVFRGQGSALCVHPILYTCSTGHKTRRLVQGGSNRGRGGKGEGVEQGEGRGETGEEGRGGGGSRGLGHSTVFVEGRLC